MTDMKGRTVSSLFYDLVKDVYSKNKTFSYMLPILGGNFNMYMGLKGCYIAHEDYPEMELNMFLWFKPKEEIDNIFIDRLKEHKYIKNVEKLKDNNTVLSFDIPEDKLENYLLFREGKYSRMSNEYKREIVTFWDARNIPNIIDVLYRKEAAYKRIEDKYDIEIPRYLEASSALNMAEETFKNEYLDKV